MVLEAYKNIQYSDKKCTKSVVLGFACRFSRIEGTHVLMVSGGYHEYPMVP